MIGKVHWKGFNSPCNMRIVEERRARLGPRTMIGVSRRRLRKRKMKMFGSKEERASPPAHSNSRKGRRGRGGRRKGGGRSDGEGGAREGGGWEEGGK